MKLNKNWILFYVKNHNFSGNIKEIFNFDHFGNVSIPTLFELELFYNNILPHPYESTNTWLYQKYEDYHQFYVVNFKGSSKHKFLRLHGVDTIANIYLNGELIGKTHNMFMHYDFELSNLKKNNELIIHVLPAVLEGKKFKFTKEMFAQPYNYESLYLRKCASSFGWDILPRTPLGGIHKDVELLSSLPLIEDLHVSATNISEKYAKLSFSLKLREENPNYKVTFEGKCGRDYFFTYDNKISLKNPKLWNIRGYGKPNLYKITVTVYLDGLVVEKKTIDFGIRKVELHRSSVVQEGGKFEFHINNQKVFLLGSNWVPIEAIKHFDDERMLKALDMVCDLGCNCLRVWGGGVYESDRFYQECNKRSIFVW